MLELLVGEGVVDFGEVDFGGGVADAGHPVGAGGGLLGVGGAGKVALLDVGGVLAPADAAEVYGFAGYPGQDGFAGGYQHDGAVG